MIIKYSVIAVSLLAYGCSSAVDHRTVTGVGCYAVESMLPGPLQDTASHRTIFRLDALVDQRTGEIERRVVRGVIPHRLAHEREHPFRGLPTFWRTQSDSVVISWGSGFWGYILALAPADSTQLLGRITSWTDNAGNFDGDARGRRIQCDHAGWLAPQNTFH